MTDWRSRRFGRAASSYHDSTPVQRRMAERLASLIPDGFRPSRILELGCGTGHLTRILATRFGDAQILASDLSREMLEASEALWPDGIRRPVWMILDAKAPNEALHRPDLVASNAVVQWFPDLRGHFRSIREMSTPGTIYAVSGFRKDHFPELERILTSEEFGYPPGPGHDPEQAIEEARATGWHPLLLHQETLVEEHPSAAGFLRHLKASGANRPPPGDKPLTRSRLQQLMSRLEAESESSPGVSITWKPWFLVMEAR